MSIIPVPCPECRQRSVPVEVSRHWDILDVAPCVECGASVLDSTSRIVEQAIDAERAMWREHVGVR